MANNSSIVWKSVSNVEVVSGGGFAGIKVIGTTAADTLDFSAVTLTGVALIDGGVGN
ncbi:MAG: hypothetical protein RL385_1606, partial [Pseudomonadota bacterium]